MLKRVPTINIVRRSVLDNRPLELEDIPEISTSSGLTVVSRASIIPTPLNVQRRNMRHGDEIGYFHPRCLDAIRGSRTDKSKICIELRCDGVLLGWFEQAVDHTNTLGLQGPQHRCKKRVLHSAANDAAAHDEAANCGFFALDFCCRRHHQTVVAEAIFHISCVRKPGGSCPDRTPQARLR